MFIDSLSCCTSLLVLEYLYKIYTRIKNLLSPGTSLPEDSEVQSCRISVEICIYD